MPGVVLANGGHSASEETGGDRTEGDIPFLGPQKSHGERSENIWEHVADWNM